MSELLEWIRLIEATEPCKTHGRTQLKICTEPACGTVYCGGCDWGSCPCANDE